jgi:hypothetical protein
MEESNPMSPTAKTWLSRIFGLLILAQSLWAVFFYTGQRLAPGEMFRSLFIAPGIYLVEIILLAAFAALLPWLKLNQAPLLLWVVAGMYAALSLTDFWTVGYYLSPSFVLALINAAYLSPSPNQFTWRNFWVFAASGTAQFFFGLAPFLKRLIF